jgi:hypothetical protein
MVARALDIAGGLILMSVPGDYEARRVYNIAVFIQP